MYWNQNAIPAIEAELGKRIVAAGDHLVSAARDLIDTPYPPASRPSSAPHRRSGALYGSVMQEFNASLMQSRIGTSLAHGKFTELGTVKMAPRPWLRRALLEQESAIVGIIGAPLPGISVTGFTSVVLNT